MSIKYPDSGIQVGSVLPKETIYRLSPACDVNFIYAELPHLVLNFSVKKPTYNLLKLSVYFINKIWDLTKK